MYKEIEENIVTPDFEREEEYINKSDDKIEKAINAALGNLKHEGMILTEREKELVRKKATGEISHEEFIRLAYEEAMR